MKLKERENEERNKEIQVSRMNSDYRRSARIEKFGLDTDNSDVTTQSLKSNNLIPPEPFRWNIPSNNQIDQRVDNKSGSMFYQSNDNSREYIKDNNNQSYLSSDDWIALLSITNEERLQVIQFMMKETIIFENSGKNGTIPNIQNAIENILGRKS